MAGYFFIQSVDSFSDISTEAQFRLMTDLAGRNNSVQMLLVQNAVFMAKKDVPCAQLDALLTKGVNVLVDDFSLAQRGIATAAIRTDVQPSEISCVVDAMLDKQKVIWN